jgi:hypothetical protein
MCDDEMKQILRDILESSNSDEYEPGGIFTVGGSTGVYAIKTPFNTECEWSLVFASVTGTAGDVNVSVSGSNPTIVSGATQVYGLLSGGGEGNNALEGWALHVSSTGASPIEFWTPLGRGGTVYVSITSVVGNAYVQIAFRRLMLKYIPDVPRPMPATHSRVQSRRPLRMIGSLSKQMSGFEQQYPTLGAKTPYLHEPIPEDQDVANISTRVNRYRPGGRQ